MLNVMELLKYMVETKKTNPFIVFNFMLIMKHGLKVVKLSDKFDKPTVSELIDKLESISKNHAIRGESNSTLTYVCLVILYLKY